MKAKALSEFVEGLQAASNRETWAGADEPRPALEQQHDQEHQYNRDAFKDQAR
jgi:hypothetical protein